MDKTINDLFRLTQIYKPQQVGIEITGQQGAFIKWLQQEMVTRNIWFSFASTEKGGAPGIRPIIDKSLASTWLFPGSRWGKCTSLKR